MSDHGKDGEEAPAPEPPFVYPQFKAEIVGLRQLGDRFVGQAAKDFDLTEPAVREWVRQSERVTGARQDGSLTADERPELAQPRAGEPQVARGRGGLKGATFFFANETR